MRRIAAKIKPAAGYGHAFHLGFTAILPILIYILVRLDFSLFAALLILLSKWRMFSVKIRHWPANIRANAVDITVGLSTVAFMSNTNSNIWQILWALLYGVWLIFIKPQTSVFWVGLQAMIGQFLGLVAIYLVWGGEPIVWLTFSVGVMCYFAARHFFSAFDETYSKTAAYLWAFIGASLAWVTSHWLIFYGVIAQPALVLTFLGYGLATMYYLQSTDKLTQGQRRQFIVVICAAIVLVLVFSSWSDKSLL